MIADAAIGAFVRADDSGGFNSIAPREFAAMPIDSWRYLAEFSGASHPGPVAQDFRSAFGLGDGDKTISTVDAEGVALAAIQGLYPAVPEKDQQLAVQASRISKQETLIGESRADLARIQAALGLNR